MKFCGNDLKSNLQNGETVFLSDLAYLNKNHANPSLTKVSFEEFLRLNKQAKDSFEFCYQQKVCTSIFSFNYYRIFSETRKFPKLHDKRALEMSFFEIFKSVSIQFETMQAEFPLSLLPGSRNSSFRNGDLMGDYFSFLQSISRLDSSTFQNKILKSHNPSMVLPNSSNNFREKQTWRDLEMVFEKLDSNNEYRIDFFMYNSSQNHYSNLVSKNIKAQISMTKYLRRKKPTFLNIGSK
jgi:hypothetical protein